MNNLKIAFMGDINPGGVLYYTGGIDKSIVDCLRDADLRIGTLECAIGDGSTLCQKKMTNKRLGNIVYCPDKCVETLKQLNINVVNLANNHICDLGLEGLKHTIEILDSYGIKHVGAGMNLSEAQQPAIIECKGYKICVLGYCMSAFGAHYDPTETEGGINYLDNDHVVEDIQKYKKTCDFVYVIPHWGGEYTLIPSYYDVETARLFIKSGADGVIASHSHTLQPIFKYLTKPIASSIGNFLFPDWYMDKPRLMVYPKTEDIANVNIPTTLGYPFVKTLTRKIVAPICRIGGIFMLNAKDDSYSVVYTNLSSDNILKVCKPSLYHRVKLKLLGFSISHPLTHRLVLRLSSKIESVKIKLFGFEEYKVNG